ncbi:MAG: radical SAM protein [Methanobacteriota archaeon]|nr:MAG: radical SAM protein [Euryarchaeota archaeon]
MIAQGNPNIPDYDHVFYFRLFEGCNVACEHCFIPSNPKRMTLDDVRRSAEKMKEIAPEHSRVLVQLHGGEPSVMGSDFLNDAVDIILDVASAWLKIDFGIQTNLILLDDGLIEFYKYRITPNQFGVSWDTDIRKLKGLGDFENVFWGNWNRIKDAGIPVIMTMTTTRQFFERFSSWARFYSFAVRRDIESIHLERLTRTGLAARNWDKIGITNMDYSHGMSVLAEGYFSSAMNGQWVPSISPFDGIFLSFRKLKSEDKKSSCGYGCWSGKCHSGFHTFDANGYKFGCTAITAEMDNKNAVIQILPSDILQSREQKRKSVCDDCDMRLICSSGCPTIDVMDESGECSGAARMLRTVASFV